MNLFFIVAGNFALMPYDRSGPKAFLRNRLTRLGMPWLVIGVLLLLAQVFAFGASDGQLGRAWPFDGGPLWFVEHLLIYSAVYAGWCSLRPRRAAASQRLADPPGDGACSLTSWPSYGSRCSALAAASG